MNSKMIESLAKVGLTPEQALPPMIGNMYYQSMMWVFLGLFSAALGTFLIYTGSKFNLQRPDDDNSWCYGFAVACYFLAAVILLANFSDMMSPEGAVLLRIGRQ